MSGPAPPRRLEREEAQALAGLVALVATTAAWWALALWPVDSGPAWLERTRFVCFGVTESGLPDVGGWIGLIFGPLGMLLILLVGWSRGVRALGVRARTSRSMAAVLAVAGIVGLLMVTGAAVRIQQARVSEEVVTELSLPPAQYPRLDRPAPELSLTRQHGDVIDLADLRGSPVLVTFAYAHCSTVCPLVVRDVLAARQALAGTARQPTVVIVTLDPWRDTPSRLPALARQWGLPEDSAWVVTGAVEDVEAVLDAWEVPRSRDPLTGEVTHPSLVYVLDAGGRLTFAAAGGAETLVSLIQRS